jgi:hypothetical protein
MQVPSTWSKRGRLPGVESIERGCVGTLPERVVLTLDDGRLRARHARRNASRRDALPYALDLSDTLVDFSQSGDPRWQGGRHIDPPPPVPPPPALEGKPARPRVADPEIEQAWLDHANREWHITYAHDYAHRRVVAVVDGWLVAFSGGEYGGSLWWYPRTPGPGRLLWRGQVRFIESLGDQFVALGGLAHGGDDDGYVLWLDRSDEGWTVRRKADLQYTPSAIFREPSGSIAVATRKSVERITPDGLHVLFPTDLPDAPSAIVTAPNGEVALGMRVYTYVLRPSAAGYRAEIYVPPGCDLTYQGYFCVCAGRGR